MEQENRFCEKLISQFRKRRYKLGLSQPQIDQKTGIADGLTAKWEIGYRKPTLFNAFAWAESLDCDLVLKPRKKQK
jgi:transcriptional regulator with XRE-family HTH domain|tara:strand:- start:606 stop:833 length:228 start_codon:yes stop_codon:yes gene_type:complete